MKQFVEIKRFPFPELIEQISEIFDSNEIEYVIENTKPSFDPFFTYEIVEYILKVNQSQKKKALELLANSFSDNFTSEGHYMDSFTDEELIEVLSTTEVWDKADLQYAKNLIKQRKIVIDEEKIKKAQHKVISELKEPKKAKPVIIILGYLFAITGALIGLSIGIHLKYKRNEVVDWQEKIFYYDKKSRNHGNNIFIICWGWAIFLISYLIN